MKRWFVLAYGVVCYVLFLGVFLYAVGFVGNFLVPSRLDAPPIREAGVSSIWWLVQDLGINLGLLTTFALQHSLMARPWFKRKLSNFLPPAMERSTYVLASNLALAILFWQWRPLGGVVWDVSNEVGQIVLYGLFAIGWGTVLFTTFLIDHFDLFGLKQVWTYFRGQEYRSPSFRTPSLYRYVRHPMYVGWLMAFWFTPTMTWSHFVFAMVTTVYILMAIRWEETDLVRHLGPAYAEYRRRVPMLLPRLLSRKSAANDLRTTSYRSKGV